MRVVELVNALTGQTVCGYCEVADKPLARMRGLLGRDTLAPNAGMLFNKTKSVHTFRMRFPIDVVFLDRELRVLAVYADVGPGRAVKASGAKWTLELAAGAAAENGIEIGTRLRHETPVLLQERRSAGSVGAPIRLPHGERRAHASGTVVGQRAPQHEAPGS
jgi:uncharacterized membrane protein (UPF0127 family)